MDYSNSVMPYTFCQCFEADPYPELAGQIFFSLGDIESTLCLFAKARVIPVPRSKHRYFLGVLSDWGTLYVMFSECKETLKH